MLNFSLRCFPLKLVQEALEHEYMKRRQTYCGATGPDWTTQEERRCVDYGGISGSK